MRRKRLYSRNWFNGKQARTSASLSISRFTQIIFGKIHICIASKIRFPFACSLSSLQYIYIESNLIALKISLELFHFVFCKMCSSFCHFMLFWVCYLSWFLLNVCRRYFSISASFLSIIFSLFSFIFARTAYSFAIASLPLTLILCMFMLFHFIFHLITSSIMDWFFFSVASSSFFLYFSQFIYGAPYVVTFVLCMSLPIFLMSRFLSAAMFAFDCHFPKIVPGWWTFIDFHVI